MLNILALNLQEIRKIIATILSLNLGNDCYAKELAKLRRRRKYSPEQRPSLNSVSQAYQVIFDTTLDEVRTVTSLGSMQFSSQDLVTLKRTPACQSRLQQHTQRCSKSTICRPMLPDGKTTNPYRFFIPLSKKSPATLPSITLRQGELSWLLPQPRKYALSNALTAAKPTIYIYGHLVFSSIQSASSSTSNSLQDPQSHCSSISSS